jgi:hypothetical protein
VDKGSALCIRLQGEYKIPLAQMTTASTSQSQSPFGNTVGGLDVHAVPLCRSSSSANSPVAFEPGVWRDKVANRTQQVVHINPTHCIVAGIPGVVVGLCIPLLFRYLSTSSILVVAGLLYLLYRTMSVGSTSLRGCCQTLRTCMLVCSFPCRLRIGTKGLSCHLRLGTKVRLFS